MTLFIDQTGDPDLVLSDVFTICGADFGLGDETVPTDSSVIQLTYAETAGQGPTADRLDQLVNTDFDMPAQPDFGIPATDDVRIVVTGLPAGVLDPHSGTDLTGNGMSYVDTTSSPAVIRAVYDLSQCNGAGIWVVDDDGNHIVDPNPVILYHELSHSLHAATGTLQANDEPAAETDENVMRDRLGITHRDINSHDGGCGITGGDDGGCLVVTAAYGSSYSGAVDRLRRVRDGVLRADAGGREFFDALHREYYRFSPQLAAAMRADGRLRAEVRDLVVAPLLEMVELAYCRVTGARALASTGESFAQLAVGRVRAAAHTASARGLDASGLGGALGAVADGGSPPLGPPLVRRLGRWLDAVGVPLPLTRWAIVAPVAAYWRCVATALEPRSDSEIETAVAAELRAWLAHGPATLPGIEEGTP
ncbi:hypothetical protein GCM10023322_47920 [Rugosimonospora acidiphila]|uniref:Uncharacterized protein n=1 Tax=Rugosimonospora acidiphila TaxID=556531 RepID=A0ABP9S5N9_9ACTN